MTDFYMKYDAELKWVNFTTSPKRKRQSQLDHSGANTGFEFGQRKVVNRFMDTMIVRTV